MKFLDEGQTVASGVDINNVCDRDKTTENQSEWRSFDRIRNRQFENGIEFWKRSSFQSSNAIRYFSTQVNFEKFAKALSLALVRANQRTRIQNQ